MKVAYVDFVTAMIAFFLLMWLLGATDEKKSKGLADYFNPSLAINRSSAGGAGMLEGAAIFADNPTSGTVEEGVAPKPTHQDDGQQLGDKDTGSNVPPDVRADAIIANGIEGIGENDVAAAETTRDDPASAGGAVGEDVHQDAEDVSEGETGYQKGEIDAEYAAALAAERSEQARLEAVGRQIAEAMRENEGGAMENHFFLRITADGLVSEIIDDDDQPLFGSGSANPAPVLPVLIDILVPVLNETVNEIAVIGHTDAVPFGGPD